MMMTAESIFPTSRLQAEFAERIQFDAPLARHTAARIGGPADALLTVESADELAHAARQFWQLDLPFCVLGSGSNVLVSDRGVRGVVVLNKARASRFQEAPEPAGLWAESGANFGALARAAAGRGLSGLEWAAGIPGTVGGAVVGNAGAHGGDMAGSLVWAELLLRDGSVERWTADRLAYAYRTSVLKARPGTALVLSAQLRLEAAERRLIEGRMEEYLAHRRKTQPPGASMGSMFKNPPGDFSGRLIDRAGLKGARLGGAEISALHGNFFVNLGAATAADVDGLIELARSTVAERFGITLELEIEYLGDWEPRP